MTYGYNKPLYILAFDHRSTLVKSLFKFKEPLSDLNAAKMVQAKQIIYQGLLAGLSFGVPKEFAAVLVDEQYGDKVLTAAKEQGITTILTVEKSGQELFDFEYGKHFSEHLEKYNPTFAKALVRYNPEGDKALNEHQREKLKILSHYCRENGFKFLIEPLIAATAEELVEVAGDKQQFDERIRPELTVRMIKELQDSGVEPDIWKIEGMERPEDYQKVVTQAKSSGRSEVSVVVLGRGESKEKVQDWLKAGKGVEGVTGFAIGRTIFWQALEEFNNGKVSEQEAAEAIGKNYFEFYKIFAA